MFDLIKISDAEYELKASSGGLVGRFLLEVDGCYYFELAEKRKSGVLSDYALDDWESFVVDPSQLEEVWEYYDKD
jgi:hypothetical protein